MKKCIVLLFSCLFWSCSQGKYSEVVSADSETAPSELKVTHVNSPTPSLVPVNTKLIKTGDYRFKVTDVKKCTEHIEAGLMKYQAFISSSNMTTQSYELENHMVLKVRNEYFDDLLKYIDTQATLIIHRNISTQDVSKEFVDLESRLKTKREVEARYTEILRSKAGTIEELLSAEEKIGELHEEIEATISRINFLKDQVAYSTIKLEFYQPIEPIAVAEEKTFMTDMGKAVETGFEGILVLIVALLYIWPIILLAAGILLFLKFRKKVAPHL